MRKALYMRLALQNFRKNGKFYIPYILTIAGTSAAFYIMLALNGNPDVPDRIRYSYLSAFVGIGTAVIALFSVIFLKDVLTGKMLAGCALMFAAVLLSELPQKKK